MAKRSGRGGRGAAAERSAASAREGGRDAESDAPRASLSILDASREIPGPSLAGEGIRRRDFLAALAAAGAGSLLGGVLGAPGEAQAAPLGAAQVFPDGIKSGDPQPDGAVIWTRLAPPAPGRPRIPVLWIVSEDNDPERVVAGGITFATAESGFAVHVRVRRLRPDRWYRYLFFAERTRSVRGRLRTAPHPGASPDRLRYAFASCQQRGVRGADGRESLYVAHRAIAREGVDFLLHLGDYVYVSDTRTLALDDYRGVYRSFHSNPLLQEVQAQVPLVAVWDDGEFYNGVDRTGAPERLAAARRAWFEAMPVLRNESDRIHRLLRWGDLADVFLLDTRQYRDPEVPANVSLNFIDGQDTRVPGVEGMFASGRTTLGLAQKEWLQLGLRASSAAWRFLGSSYNVGAWKYLDLDTPRLRAMDPNLLRNGGVYVSNEAWDDYQAERREILERILADGVQNVVFTSGHTHFYLATELQPDFDDEASPVAAFDFTTGSQTADPDPRTLADEGFLRLLETYFKVQNAPYMKAVDLVCQGYAVVDATPEECIVSFRVVDTFDPDAEARTAHRFRVASGGRALEVLPAEP